MRGAVVALVLLASSLARAAPTVELYTMGAGDEIFSAFGHAAICVTDGEAPGGRCYNYGTADFTTPVPLTWNFIRGRALFWVSVTDTFHMLRYYQHVGRAVWRQTLTLTPPEAERVAAALAASADERVKYYRYHHFDDNCTTRIRDLLDRATDGRLGRDRTDRRLTFRQWARQGFAGDAPLLAAVEMLLGRSADRRTDSWQAMFLPSELRDEVARRYRAPPVEVVRGQPRPPAGATWLGQAAFFVAGALLALLLVVHLRTGRIVAGVVLGLVGLILWALAALSTFPELTRNELLFSFWPTDFALPWLGRRYLNARLVVLGLVVLLHLGLFVQPLAPSLLALLPLAVARWKIARRT
ncbi:MAG: hypothetical protein JWN44_1332 [Myxococcales bacterium]|nr:hypothetical protein [Myxococcales bacterium]